MASPSTTPEGWKASKRCARCRPVPACMLHTRPPPRNRVRRHVLACCPVQQNCRPLTRPLAARLLPALPLQAVEALEYDPVFRWAQDQAMEQLYYNPSQQAAAALGLRWAPRPAGGVGCKGVGARREGHWRRPESLAAGSCGATEPVRPTARVSKTSCCGRGGHVTMTAPPWLLGCPRRRLPLSKAQLYDAWVQHGSADPQSQVFARSANGIISCE